jgi:hypothetical protein
VSLSRRKVHRPYVCYVEFEVLKAVIMKSAVLWVASPSSELYGDTAKITILSHTDPLLGNDSETNNDTTAIARQQLREYATVMEPC